MSIDAFIPPAEFPLSPPLDPEWSLQDLQTHLGGVPMNRIRLWPSPGAADEAAMLRSGGCELVDGVLVEKAIGYFQDWVAAELLHYIRRYLDTNDLGIVLGSSAPYRIGKRLIRMPDVSFFVWEHFPQRIPPAINTLPFAPELAVEVLSDSNTVAEMERKRKDFFAAGTKLFWIVEPQLRTIDVYVTPSAPVSLREQDTLDGGDVLPGFVLPVRELFARIPPLGEQPT